MRAQAEFADEYELGEAAGARRGREPSVWKATPKFSGGTQPAEEVAVKLLPAPPDCRSRREASMLQAVQGHPNVVKLRGVFWAPKSLEERGKDKDKEAGKPLLESLSGIRRKVLVTEFCAGGSLSWDLAVAGPLSWTDAAHVCNCMLQALSHIHGVGVVHRDVQPANLLLREDGEVVLTGFALAACATDKEEMRKRCGAPGFAAPEVIRGSGCGPIADMFSAGCTIYCTLSGTGSPFSNQDPAAAILQTLTKNVKFQGGVEIETLSSQGKSFLQSMLEKDPKRRVTAARALEDPWLQKTLLRS